MGDGGANVFGDDSDLLMEMAADGANAAKVVAIVEGLPEDAVLASLKALIAQYAARCARIEELKEELKKEQKLFDNLSKVAIPTKLDEAGVSALRMVDGSIVEANPFVSVSIVDEHEDAAYEWLTSIGAGGMIKNTVTVPFGRELGDEAKKFMDELSSKGYTYTNKVRVEPPTLKAFAKDRITSGGTFPEEHFSVFSGRITKITPPKVKKGK